MLYAAAAAAVASAGTDAAAAAATAASLGLGSHAVAASGAALVLAYGAARASTAICNEARNAVFAKVRVKGGRQVLGPDEVGQGWWGLMAFH